MGIVRVTTGLNPNHLNGSDAADTIRFTNPEFGRNMQVMFEMNDKAH